MTNKEAAFILSDNCYDYSTEELRTAFDLAIKALEKTNDTTFREVVAYECGQKSVERPQDEWIPVKDLINYIRTCREELFEKMKDYHPREFEIRDSMLTNFEQIVKLASSKYKADVRGGKQ